MIPFGQRQSLGVRVTQKHQRFAIALLGLVLSVVACNSPSGGSLGEGSGGAVGGGGWTSDASGKGGAGSDAPVHIINTSPDGGSDLAGGSCGNRKLDPQEQCDDGNTITGDGCNRACQVESNFECSKPGTPCVFIAKCGNGVLTSDETCDDGNTVGGDGCAADCASIEPGWQCRVPGRPCGPACGDGALAAGEACDDGDVVPGDGCGATCKVEPGFHCVGQPSRCSATVCGDGVKGGAEGCDDGNTMPFDGCSQDCQSEPDCSGASCTSRCGDGIVLSEDCDDGNAASGDGCSSTCQIEEGWTCRQPDLGDTMNVPVVYRDFRFHTPSDFEPDVEGSIEACVGMVEPTLDRDGKPVSTGIVAKGGTISSKEGFAQWYRTTSGVNHATAARMALWRVSSGAYVNRYGAKGEQWKPGIDGNPLFFPVDGDTFTPASERAAAQVPGFYDPVVPYDVDGDGNQRLHNFSFTSEVRYWFKYEDGKSYQLDFVGDDDVWVFVNKTLAVDLGGLHPAVAGSFVLDASTATKLGNLKAGNVYEVVVFHAERHTTASSYKLTLTGFNAAPTACIATCGDGVAVANEECDDGKANSDTAYGGCTTACRWGAFCGDGLVNGPEECDDGKANGTSGPGGCTLGCTRPPYCGDGRVDSDRGEECDMGDKNGLLLDSALVVSSEPSAKVYCKPDCKIPEGLVF